MRASVWQWAMLDSEGFDFHQLKGQHIGSQNVTFTQVRCGMTSPGVRVRVISNMVEEDEMLESCVTATRNRQPPKEALIVL